MEETAYLLRSPKNAARLMAAIEEIESGRANIPWPESAKRAPEKKRKARRARGK
jgi:hypothetical protein